jgi:hypothetical protein
MEINFGKCRVEFLRWPGSSYPTVGTWGRITEPIEGSVVLTTNEGTDLEAKIEGGQVIDKLAGKNTYQLTVGVYVKKGQALPFTDRDGVVEGTYAVRVIPVEDETCPGILIKKSTIKAAQDYSVNDGWRYTYTVMALVPGEDENTVQPYTASAAVASGFSLKVGSSVVATQERDTPATLTAGNAELTVTGTNLNSTIAATIKVGNNIIGLTKKSSSTATQAVFEGVTSAGSLTEVKLDSVVLKSF